MGSAVESGEALGEHGFPARNIIAVVEVVFSCLVETGKQLRQYGFGAGLVPAFYQGVELPGEGLDLALRAFIADPAFLVLANALFGLEAICHGGIPEQVSIYESLGYYFEAAWA